MARPCFNPSANSWWDRKLGIWPIGDWEPAKWKSKNKPKGTLVWKNKMVTKEVYRELLISKFILAILENWPSRDRMSRTIFIQQDSAKNHIHEDDEEFNNVLMEQDIDENSTCKHQIHLTLTCWIWVFLEPFRASTMHHQRMKKS